LRLSGLRDELTRVVLSFDEFSLAALSLVELSFDELSLPEACLEELSDELPLSELSFDDPSDLDFSSFFEFPPSGDGACDLLA